VTPAGRLRPDPLAVFTTTTSGETGALGVAFGDDELYVFVSDPDGVNNRVIRVDARSGAAEEVVEEIPGSGYHNGGGVVWDDGILYVSNGETHDSVRAQDPDALGGKVYRFTEEGDIPSDNPFGDSPAFAIGLRNPFGMTMDPVSKSLFVTENGPESHDEVNRIEAGGNYGWPDVSGPAEAGATDGLIGDYHDPLLDYPTSIVPTGIAFADPDEALDEFAGDLFFGSFGEGAIHHVELNKARDEAVSDEVLVEEDDGVVAVAWGPGGLYYSTPTSIKLLPLGTDPSPVRRIEQEPSGFRVQTILAAVAFVALAGAALLVNRRARRAK
jgi:glucose/arabinose dehydrogenase